MITIQGQWEMTFAQLSCYNFIYILYGLINYPRVLHIANFSVDACFYIVSSYVLRSSIA